MASLTKLWVGWWRQGLSSGKQGGWLRVCYGETEEQARAMLERYVKLPGTRCVLEEGVEPYARQNR